MKLAGALSALKSAQQHGVLVRLADRLSVTAVVFDGTVAMLPLDATQPLDASIVIEDSATVSALSALLRDAWMSGRELQPVAHLKEVSVGVNNHRLLELLVAGSTDAAAAAALGISERSVRRVAAQIMSATGAKSRFQAGFHLGRLRSLPPPSGGESAALTP